MSTYDSSTMTRIREYLKSVENPKPQNGSGFVLPDGEFIYSSRELSHDQVFERMLDTIIIPKALYKYGVICVTNLSAIAINANIEHITNKQLHALAVHIIKYLKPNCHDSVLFDMKSHPKSRYYCAKLQKLVGSQYRVLCIS